MTTKKSKPMNQCQHCHAVFDKLKYLDDHQRNNLCESRRLLELEHVVQFQNQRIQLLTNVVTGMVKNSLAYNQQILQQLEHMADVHHGNNHLMQSQLILESARATSPVRNIVSVGDYVSTTPVNELVDAAEEYEFPDPIHMEEVAANSNIESIIAAHQSAQHRNNEGKQRNLAKVPRVKSVMKKNALIATQKFIKDTQGEILRRKEKAASRVPPPPLNIEGVVLALRDIQTSTSREKIDVIDRVLAYSALEKEKCTRLMDEGGKSLFLEWLTSEEVTVKGYYDRMCDGSLVVASSLLICRLLVVLNLASWSSTDVVNLRFDKTIRRVYKLFVSNKTITLPTSSDADRIQYEETTNNLINELRSQWEVYRTFYTQCLNGPTIEQDQALVKTEQN